tara:strand:+ start:1497 stop:1937 length:441 start_codon:yes stop_codon:yes gene_type:complete
MEYLYNFLQKTDNCIPKVNYEDVKISINNSTYLLINTLPNHEQSCLIYDTVNFAHEEQIINNLLNNNKMQNIIIYGRNCNDISVYKKYKQFSELGFSNVYIYLGGLFEWLLLQDIYGRDIFKTTSKELDIIKYKPLSILEKKRINY